ncbi:hypothetical protein AOLI_G00101880 [Acnodon oligacanthus]
MLPRLTANPAQTRHRRAALPCLGRDVTHDRDLSARAWQRGEEEEEAEQQQQCRLKAIIYRNVVCPALFRLWLVGSSVIGTEPEKIL